MADKNDRENSNVRNAPCPNTGISPSGEKIYEIHVSGQLDSRWSEWLEGPQMNLVDKGEMVLIGPIVDQAALIGVINKLSRLNLALLSVNEVKKQERLIGGKNE